MNRTLRSQGCLEVSGNTLLVPFLLTLEFVDLGSAHTDEVANTRLNNVMMGMWNYALD